MSDEYLGKKVTLVDGGLSTPITVWHPDILLRLRDFCASPNLFADGEVSSGYVRDMLRDARDEIERLRMTDAEREAIEHAADTSDVAAEFYSGKDHTRADAAVKHTATLRGLLERMGGGA